MEPLKQLWVSVAESKTAEEEKAAIARVKAHVKQKKIVIKAVIVNQQGQETPYEKFSGKERIHAVKLTFITSDGQFEPASWSPRDEDNFYWLFLE